MNINKKRLIPIIIGIVIVICFFAYRNTPRINVTQSINTIEKTNKKVINNEDDSYVASLSVKNKIKKTNIFNNAEENTLLNKGAGILSDISTGFEKKDYTFIRGHVETVFQNLDMVKVGDIIDINLKDGKQLKYKVTKIHTEKYNDNSNIFTYTNEVGISISTCSKQSKNKKRPEKNFVVDAILIK